MRLPVDKIPDKAWHPTEVKHEADGFTVLVGAGGEWSVGFENEAGVKIEMRQWRFALPEEERNMETAKAKALEAIEKLKAVQL